MATIDHHLIEAVEDALHDAASEAEQAALIAAIAGDELPSNPEILLGAIFKAAEELGGFWENMADRVAAWMHGGDWDAVDETRIRVKHMTRAVEVLIEAIVEQVDVDEEGGA